jgi:NodT family efflux transporter outer membrane factor (OMF) lipoprotein
LYSVTLALSLGGCTTTPPRTPTLPEVAVPEAWSTAAPGTLASTHSLAQWWQRFDDALLSTLVIQALQASTTVRSAQAALQQARALRDVASANLSPNLNASVSAQRNQVESNEASSSFNAGFDASWEADVFGARRSTLSVAESEASAAEAGLADAQVSIAAEVALTYIELRGLQARLAIADNNLASQRETLQITAWRVQAGLGSSLDLEQARAALAQTNAQIPSLEISAAQAKNSLAVLTGQAPGALQATLSAAGAVPQAPDDLALSIPAETLRQRPDVRAAEHRISAALARVSQAEAARYPSFRISGSLGVTALSLGGLATAATASNALLASISVPLFDGGAARAQVRAQEAALESARVSYQATVLGALQDVENALVSLRGDRDRLTLLQTAADAAANADLLARQRYASGLIDFRTVLETQRTLLSTQDGVESTRTSLSADHVRLYKALGGGWESAADPSKP